MDSRLVPKMNSHISSRVWNVVFWILAYVTVSIPGAAVYGQVRLPGKGGVPMGKFTFYPSAILQFGRDSNVLLRSESSDVIPSGLYVARLNLMMDMPLGANYIRWAYSPQYKNYTSDQFVYDNPMSHFFDLDSGFHLGRSFTLGFTTRYVRGVTEVQEYDPGGELAFSLAPFTLRQPRLSMEFRFGARQRLAVIPRYTQARFRGSGANALFSYDTEAIQGKYGFQISAPTEMFVLFDRAVTQQARNQNQFGQLSTLRTEAAGIGFSRSINESVVTSFTTAYTTVDVEGGEGSNFAGMSYELVGNWRLTDQIQVNVTGTRRPYQSFFLNNDYYINNLLSAQLTQQIGSRTSWQAKIGYFVNQYPNGVSDLVVQADPTLLPSLGVERHDVTGEAEIGVSYRLSPSMSMFFGYAYRQRRSNIRTCSTNPCNGEEVAPFSYTNDRIVFRIETGWL